jgi:hypothetical protein
MQQERLRYFERSLESYPQVKFVTIWREQYSGSKKPNTPSGDGETASRSLSILYDTPNPERHPEHALLYKPIYM